MTSQHDRRIARNSAFLYARMLITIGISLYTSRVVLEKLGIDDFGIYNVVGSIVTIFAFLNGTMAGATQRFLNFEMGRRRLTRLRHTFSSALLIHIGIALLVVLGGETIGLWYVDHKLVAEPSRIHAAMVTYQLSLAACVCTIVQVPYMASVIAHERMDALAVITLLNALLKLAVALMLAFGGSVDTLIMYAWLMLAVSVFTMVAYMVYAHRSFDECRPGIRVPARIVKNLLGFSVSDIFGNLCYSLRLQSVAVILNRFGGEALNAAVGLNLTVSGAITQFGTTILSAFRPQIVQQYAGGNLEYMQRLMANCSKYSLLMVSLIAVPAFIGMNFLLGIWLVDVPAYTAAFCRLTLIAGAAELVVYTINCGIHATGSIRLMSITTGAIYLVEIPTMWLLLWLSHSPWIVYALHIAVIFIVIVTVGLLLHRQMPEFRFGQFLAKGVAVPLSIIAPAAILAVGSWMLFDTKWLAFIVAGAVSTLVMTTMAWRLAIDADTRRAILLKAHLSRFIKS